MKNLEPKTEEEWNFYLKAVDETELNMKKQYPENSATISWSFSLLKLDNATAYAKWAMKKASRGLK